MLTRSHHRHRGEGFALTPGTYDGSLFGGKPKEFFERQHDPRGTSNNPSPSAVGTVRCMVRPMNAT